MKAILIELDSLQDLLLLRSEYIYRLDYVYFYAQISEDFAVIWLIQDKDLKYKEKNIKFLKLNDNLSLDFSTIAKSGYIPIIDIQLLGEMEDFVALLSDKRAGKNMEEKEEDKDG